ncbi:MAG: protein-glutamine gamma-glutamyltransferase [Candidatus Binatota bacterium]|nr:protein-glutamine gamma-glutamyltransferase [Candidatus Binatota bacterium]
MSFERKFLIASHGLAVLGVLAVATTGEVSAAYVGLALAALLWGIGQLLLGRRGEVDSRLAGAASLVALAVVVGSLVYGDASPVQAISEFLLVLLALKALSAKASRDWLQIYVLSFFQLVAASALTIEPVFAVVFLAYLLLAPWTLVLFQLRRQVIDAGEGARLQEEAFVDASLLRSVVVVTFLLFICTVSVFVVFPRVGAGFFANPLGARMGLSGFSDQVELGDVTALKADTSVAMRVTLDEPDALLDDARYWRGAVLDAYDGRRWMRGRHELRLLDVRQRGVFQTPQRVGRGPVVRQEIILEPMDLTAIFTLGRALEIRGRFSGIYTDVLGNLRGVWPGGTRMRFEVTATLGEASERPTPESLQRAAIDPRITALVAKLVDGIPDDVSRARALLRYFRHGYSYTLTPGAPGKGDPLAYFLFESRRGHCEYFASALAVMLREAGIPSRLANGYQGGDWNPYGGYFLVRQSNAHSWVEAYIDGRWKTLDPTPAAGRAGQGVFGDLGALVDATQMRWYRYVVNYSASDQIDLAFALRDSSLHLWSALSLESLRSWFAPEDGDATGSDGAYLQPWMIGLALLAAVAALFFWRRFGRNASEGREPLAWVSRRYVTMLDTLERRGLDKTAAETPDEFYRKVAARLGGQADVVERITLLYQEARFSGRDDALERARVEIDPLLERLSAPEP